MMDSTGFQVLFLLLLRTAHGSKSNDFLGNCRSPLGMGSGAIPDNALTASSTFEEDDNSYGPQRARLNLSLPSHGYRAGDASDSWIIVNLGKETVVTGIATQGYGDPAVEEWISGYRLMYWFGDDFLHFKETSGEIKNFTGNINCDGVQHHDVPLPVMTSAVMVRPLDWNNNVGLRMELYGCDPGYFFLARFTIAKQQVLFTLPFLDKDNEDYRTWSADTINEIKYTVQYIPGFLEVKFRGFRMSTDLSQMLVSAEVEIHCIEKAAHFIANLLSRSVGPEKSMFASKIDFIFPVNSSCPFPKVDINLNKTLTTATEVLTTSKVTLRADITLCRTHIKSIESAVWEFMIIDEPYLMSPLLTIHNATEYELDPRFCADCYPASMLVRFTVNITGVKGSTLESFGFLKIKQPTVVVKIIGPEKQAKGINAEIVLNASDSHDPDKRNVGNLSFTWFCGQEKVEIPFQGTRCLYGRTQENGKLLIVNVNKLRSRHAYEFKLVVSKGDRNNYAVHELQVLPAVSFTFRCVRNCGVKILQSKRMRLVSECDGKLCSDVKRTTWTIYAYEGSTKLWNRIAREHFLGLSLPPSNFIMQGLTSHSATIKTRDPKYKLKATIEIRVGQDVLEEEHSMDVSLNSVPVATGQNRDCFVQPSVGYAVETTFNITCVGWEDEDGPIKREFRYNTSAGVVINNPNTGTGLNTLSTKLPVGDRSQNFQFPVAVYIKDALGDFTIKRVIVKVKDHDSEDINKTMFRIANNQPNKVKDYVSQGKYTEACDLAISVISVLEGRKGQGHSKGKNGKHKPTISKEEVKRIKDNIIKQMKYVKINSKELVSKVSAVVAMTTNERDEISQHSQGEALRLLDEATDFLTQLVTNNTEEAESLTKDVSRNLLLGLGNILKISSKDADVTSFGLRLGQTKRFKKKSKMIAIEAVKTTWKLRDCIVVNMADDEPVVITSSFLSMVLFRSTRKNITRVDSVDFMLPSYGRLFSELSVNESDITSKIVLFKSNPYTWHKSASTVRSWVIDVVLQKEDKTNLNITGLKNPVNLYVPQNRGKRASPGTVLSNTIQYFVKPSYDLNETFLIQNHRINIPHDRDVVFVKLLPEISTYAQLRVYVRYSDFSTPTEHNISTVLPICENLGNDKMDVNCFKDPKNYEFSFTASDTGHVGVHYIGIHYYVESAHDVMPVSDDAVSTERIKKSCGNGSGRKKRSCVGTKPAPLPPTPSPIVQQPLYNATTDLKYSLSVNIGSCLYWSGEEWTDEGCKVTSDVVWGSINCRCNHLSAFGGDFFVAPNEIDFKKVFSAFVSLGETKNVVVLTTVCTILLLYLIGLIFARRADRRDKQKKVPNVHLPDGEEIGNHHYHISLATGMWMGSGTTANVGIVIYGEDCYTERIILNDSISKKAFFARASVNTFTVSLPRNLGQLYKIRLWHDNTGGSPGWFLLDVVITELRTQQRWYFIANRWIAVEKANGEVDIEINACDKKEASKFKNIFYSRASKRLADGHLWISVLTRPPQSLFTRTQRLSCCMSVLFSAMITNAMFYDFGNTAQDTFQVGPLTMSWTQVRVGVQSALIALPVNAIIVAIFRNVKPQKKKNKERELQDQNSPKGLPYYFIYIAWVICVLTIFSSAFFTVLYSLFWGADVSNKWLTSILISFLQDVFVSQPIQVVLIASLLSVLIRKPMKHDLVHGLPYRKNHCENDSKVKPPEEKELNKARTFWAKLRKMFRSVVEIILFVIFVILLFVVCYGNRDTSRYHLTRSLREILVDERVNSIATFWNWTRRRLVPGVFLSESYNGQRVDLEEGFISSGYPFLVGMPRLRQIRVKTDACQVEDLVEVRRCFPYYSSKSEDKIQYNLRDWTPVLNISEFEASFILNDLCPTPWRYQSAETLETLSFHGFYATYGGGGYVADLGYNAETAIGVIDDLENSGWIDERTFAVFVEFTVYEPSSTLFSAVKYLYERYPTGGTKTTSTFDTLMIYYPVDPTFRSFYLLCQLLLVFLIFGLFLTEIIKLYFQGCKYFTHIWNLVEMSQIISAVAAIIQYFFKAKYTSEYVRRVRHNPFETSSSDYVVRWCNLEIWLLSFVVFLVTIKMLRLLKFNHHICHLTYTVNSAAKHLLSYSAVFTATLLAYTQLGTMLFGRNAAAYSNMARCLTRLLERILGNNMFTKELLVANDILCQLFIFAYSFSIAMVLINMFLSIINSSYIEVRTLKRGRYPEVELAQFTWRYFLRKVQTFWYDTKSQLRRTNEAKVRLKRRNAKPFGTRKSNVLDDSDSFFCKKYDQYQSVSYLCSEGPSQKAAVDDFDDVDIDLVDEYSSLKNVKAMLLQMGTTFFLNKYQWSSISLNDDDDDDDNDDTDDGRDDTGSLKRDWSDGFESDQSLFDCYVVDI